MIFLMFLTKANQNAGKFCILFLILYKMYIIPRIFFTLKRYPQNTSTLDMLNFLNGIIPIPFFGTVHYEYHYLGYQDENSQQ